MDWGTLGKLARRRQNLRVHARTGRAAFALVELLITLCLVLLMGVMLYGPSSRSRQSQLKKTCQKNLHAIYVGLDLFAQEHDGAFPLLPGARTAEEPLALLVPRYTTDTAPFICPGSRDQALPSAEPFAGRKISYAYVMGLRLTDAREVLMSDRQVNAYPKAQGQQAFSATGQPPGNNHHKYGGNLLFADGRCEPSSAFAPCSLLCTQGIVLLNPKP